MSLIDVATLGPAEPPLPTGLMASSGSRLAGLDPVALAGIDEDEAACGRAGRRKTPLSRI